MLYDEYFERMESMKATYMLREHIKFTKEYFVLECFENLLMLFKNILSIPNIEIQEKLKITLIDTIKKIVPRVRLNVYSTMLEVQALILAILNEQSDKIKSLQKENRENEKTNIYKVIAGISLALNMKLNPIDLSVSEFIEYYKIANENGK